MIWRLLGMSEVETTVARRYLRSKREEGFISVVAWFSLLGILLGVGTLIVVMSVFNGFRAELLSRIIDLNGHVTVSNLERRISDYETLTARLSARDDVVSATPIVQGQVMATAGTEASGAVVMGLDPGAFKERPFLRNGLKQGGADWDGRGDGVLIGTRMAEELRIGVGDSITLISPNGAVTPFGTVPRVKTYVVAGLFEFGMYQFDRSHIYMPIGDAQVFFKTGDVAGSIELTLREPAEARPAAFEIRQQLGPGYTATDWSRVNLAFFNDIQVQRNVVALILSLIVLVATFNVISSQIMLVRDKTRGIAILRTLGVTRATVLRIFLITGSSIGIVGTGLGAIAGIAFAANIEPIRRGLEGLFGVELFDQELYYLSELPATIEPTEVAVTVVLSLVLSILASLYPAWRAAQLDPSEVLRYE